MNKEKLFNYLNLLLILLGGLACFYISCNAILFAKNPGQGFVLWQSLLVTGIILAVFGALIALNVKRGLYKPNWVLIGILGLLFIVNTINIIAYKNDTSYTFMSANREYEYTVVMNFNAEERAVAIFSFLGTMLGALLILDIVHQVTEYDKLLKYVCFIVLAVALVLIIIGIVKFPNRYFLLYEHLTDGQLYHASIPSIFQTKNEYAVVLYVAVLAGIYLHHYYRKWYWLVASAYAWINIVHTLSKAMVIIGFVTIIAYLLTIFFTTYKTHKKMNIIAISIIGGFFGLVLIAGLIYLGVTDKFKALADSIYYTKGSDTFQTRQFIWEKTLILINNTSWFKGTGHIFFGEILHEMNLTDITNGEATARYSAHCAYLQYIGEGGVLFLLAELSVMGYVIYLGVRLFKENKEQVILSFTIITLYLAIMCFESATVGIASTLDYAIITLFSLVPILYLSRKNNIFLAK